MIAGNGANSITVAAGNNLIWGNEDVDHVVVTGGGNNTVFGGQGDDSIRAGAGADSLVGGEGKNGLSGGAGIDTLTGGADHDRFYFDVAGFDGENAAGGGPRDWIADLNWTEDFVATATQVTFAANLGAFSQPNLAATANVAISAAYAMAGDSTAMVAAQFTFGGRTFLAINQDGAYSSFDDATDVLVDITGAIGSIAANRFMTP